MLLLKSPSLEDKIHGVGMVIARTVAGCLAVVILAVGQPAMAGGDVVPPKVDATGPGGMNVADGSINLTVTDLAIGPLVLDRFMMPPLPSSQEPVNDAFFGSGMTSNFDIYVAPNFTKPVRIIWGAADKSFKPKFARRLAETFPNAHLSFVEGGKTIDLELRAVPGP